MRRMIFPSASTQLGRDGSRNGLRLRAHAPSPTRCRQSDNGSPRPTPTAWVRWRDSRARIDSCEDQDHAAQPTENDNAACVASVHCPHGSGSGPMIIGERGAVAALCKIDCRIRGMRQTRWGNPLPAQDKSCSRSQRPGAALDVDPAKILRRRRASAPSARRAARNRRHWCRKSPNLAEGGRNSR